MLNLADIYRKDRATRQRGKRALVLGRVSLGVVAALLGALFSAVSLDLLAAILAVQSILAGFGFNVLVFLSTNKAIPVPSSAKIERRLKIERVNKLGREIFFNISYFNILALSCIAIALIIAVANSFSGDGMVSVWRSHYHFTVAGKRVVGFAQEAMPRLAAALLYLMITLSLLTFVRLIRRATYFFEQKIALAERDS